MASSKDTYCLCGQPYINGQFMIECDCCREWFHGSCVHVKIYQSDDIDKYHCPKCAITYGPSVLKTPTNNHRADRYELSADARPSQVGSPAWVRALAALPLRSVPAALHRMRPQHFTEEFLRDNGFTRPVIFHTNDGLGMKTPNPATFTVRSVLRYCGAQLEVEVIDVRKQSTLRMPLVDFVDYFETPPEQRDEKVLNVLSLEFSDTNMSPLVEPPTVVRALDWANVVWPAADDRPPRPAVQKYCLMSSAGSYTDFHVDFGGTTVWYHVLHGRKIFYLVPPTQANLALYQQWSASHNQNERFFGDMVEWYGSTEVCAGQTLCIPSGWVHAVLTPTDSLVFGGNFLHSYAIETQLQIYEIERRVETPVVFRYPLFEAMHWLAGAHILALLRRHNEETQDEEFTLQAGAGAEGAVLPPLLLRGARLLSAALKEWHSLKSSDQAKRDNVPKCLNSSQLVRELAKELRTLEKRTASAAKDKDVKQKTTSPNKGNSKKQNAKKSLKLTLPKPIMHMGQNGEFVEEKIYADKFFIDNKEVVYQDNRYITPDLKYGNGLQETKYIVDKELVLPEKNYNYQNYDEVQGFENGYIERQEKKNILKIKMNNSGSSREPPPYPLPEHSILKSHLVRDRPKPHHHWTISKEDTGDYTEQILFTNDNLQTNIRIDGQDLNYGPGMYSAEDIQQDYQYSETAKPGSYPGATYGFQQPATFVEPFARYEELQVPDVQQGASYSLQEPSGPQYAPPPYDAAVAHQYVAVAHTDYVVEETKPVVVAVPVRRSGRAARRRVSRSWDYEDGDLFIDETPAPRRRARPKHHASNSSSGSYRDARRLAPANGIESLIQASVLAEEEPVNDTEDAAVAGMLSISSRYAPPPSAPSPPRAPAAPSEPAPPAAPAPAPTFGLAAPQPSTQTHDNSTSSSSSKRRRPAAGTSGAEEPDDDDVIKEVHRDEEYVYPSLEMSSEDEDDEDEDWSKSRRRRNSRNRVDLKSKSDKDESWSPRARLGRLVPRLRGPARAGVRREAVRAALHHAAARLPRHHHDQVDAGTLFQNAKRAVLAAKSRRPPPAAHDTPNNKNMRLKKGMKTAKQRLGKILKLHKMIY